MESFIYFLLSVSASIAYDKWKDWKAAKDKKETATLENKTEKTSLL